MADGPHFTKYGQALNDFGLQLGLGEFPYITETHKFGASTSLTTEFTPVATGSQYRTPQTAVQLRCYSNSSEDSTSGTGAHTVKWTGINSTYGKQDFYVTLNGTSPVNLTNSSDGGTDIEALRIYRGQLTGSGTYAQSTAGSHVGDIILESTSGDLWARIRTSGFPRGQSEIACYTVKAGVTAYVYPHHLSIDAGKAVDFLFFQRPNIDTVTPPYEPMRMIREYVGLEGYIPVSDDAAPLGPFVGPCDIGWMAKASATAEVTVEFEIILVDNDQA